MKFYKLKDFKFIFKRTKRYYKQQQKKKIIYTVSLSVI